MLRFIWSLINPFKQNSYDAPQRWNTPVGAPPNVPTTRFDPFNQHTTSFNPDHQWFSGNDGPDGQLAAEHHRNLTRQQRQGEWKIRQDMRD